MNGWTRMGGLGWVVWVSWVVMSWAGLGRVVGGGGGGRFGSGRWGVSRRGGKEGREEGIGGGARDFT